MPFPQQTPTPFARQWIENLNPNQTGVYGIYSGPICIYVGKAGDLRQRLLEHLNGDNFLITAAGPTHFVTMLANPPDAAEKALIIELRPRCNQRIG